MRSNCVTGAAFLWGLVRRSWTWTEGVAGSGIVNVPKATAMLAFTCFMLY